MHSRSAICCCFGAVRIDVTIKAVRFCIATETERFKGPVREEFLSNICPTLHLPEKAVYCEPVGVIAIV